MKDIPFIALTSNIAGAQAAGRMTSEEACDTPRQSLVIEYFLEELRQKDVKYIRHLISTSTDSWLIVARSRCVTYEAEVFK